MSHVLNSSTSRSSDHRSFTVVTPLKAIGTPPLTRSANGCLEARRLNEGPSDFKYGTVVGVPIQPTTIGSPAGRGVCRGTKTFVSTHVGSTLTAVLYARA